MTNTTQRNASSILRTLNNMMWKVDETLPDAETLLERGDKLHFYRQGILSEDPRWNKEFDRQIEVLRTHVAAAEKQMSYLARVSSEYKRYADLAIAQGRTPETATQREVVGSRFWKMQVATRYQTLKVWLAALESASADDRLSVLDSIIAQEATQLEALAAMEDYLAFVEK